MRLAKALCDPELLNNTKGRLNQSNLEDRRWQAALQTP
jgi:hypothetical protein